MYGTAANFGYAACLRDMLADADLTDGITFNEKSPFAEDMLRRGLIPINGEIGRIGDNNILLCSADSRALDNVVEMIFAGVDILTGNMLNRAMVSYESEGGVVVWPAGETVANRKVYGSGVQVEAVVYVTQNGKEYSGEQIGISPDNMEFVRLFHALALTSGTLDKDVLARFAQMFASSDKFKAYAVNVHKEIDSDTRDKILNLF